MRDAERVVDHMYATAVLRSLRGDGAHVDGAGLLSGSCARECIAQVVGGRRGADAAPATMYA
jgi:hypothetical protein